MGCPRLLTTKNTLYREENKMKKLNITKKQYDESKYFNKKYGALKYVSESGKVYKTDKGVVLALESEEDDTEEKKDAGEDVTRGALTDMLKDVVDQVEKVCDAQDISFEKVAGIETPEGESDEGADLDEVVATKDEVADELQKVIDAVKDVAEKGDIELPEAEDDEEEKKDDEDEKRDGTYEFDEGEEEEVCPTCGAAMKKECGKGGCVECDCTECDDPALAKESRRKMVREAIARRARIRKVRESIRRRRAAKVLESIRRRRALKKVMEARKLRARRARMMESRKLRMRRIAH